MPTGVFQAPLQGSTMRDSSSTYAQYLLCLCTLTWALGQVHALMRTSAAWTDWSMRTTPLASASRLVSGSTAVDVATKAPLQLTSPQGKRPSHRHAAIHHILPRYIGIYNEGAKRTHGTSDCVKFLTCSGMPSSVADQHRSIVSLLCND